MPKNKSKIYNTNNEFLRIIFFNLSFLLLAKVKVTIACCHLGIGIIREMKPRPEILRENKKPVIMGKTIQNQVKFAEITPNIDRYIHLYFTLSPKIPLFNLK